MLSKLECILKCYLDELFASQIMNDFIYLSNFDYSSNERTNSYSPYEFGCDLNKYSLFGAAPMPEQSNNEL